MNKTAQKIQRDFFQKLGDSNRYDQLLPPSSGVYSFIKDRNGIVITANQLTIERCGFQLEEEIVGKTDYDLFSSDLAEKYASDDQKVMNDGIAIIDMPELAPNKDGVIHCYITNKIPLRDPSGLIIGIMGTTTSVEYSRRALKGYLDIVQAVDYIKIHYTETINIPELAELSGLKNRKFEGVFKDVFGITPQTYIIKMRLHEACLKLLNTNKSIADIATAVGFYDHSAFTRQFNKHIKITPVSYRKKYS
jgi:AraC-like DNA-binding protein